MKILGIDLGTSSIGFALIDKKNEKILHLGTHTFQSGIRKKGVQDIIPNAERTQKRGARRVLYRSKQRQADLLICLAEHDMLPFRKKEVKLWLQDTSSSTFFLAQKDIKQSNANLQAWLKQDPYLLRNKALEEKITLHQLGRILYHIAKRRGFQSNRKDQNTGERSTLYKGLKGKESKRAQEHTPLDYTTGISETKYEINKDYRTLGEFLYNISPKLKAPYTDKNPRIRARYTEREMYINEFDKIWDKQAAYHSVLNKEGLKKIIGGSKEDKKRRGILFDQRPLQSQKHLVGKCTLEPNKTRCPLSHPLFEAFRAYKLANTIQVNNRPISQESRKSVADKLLSSKKDVPLTNLKKIIQEQGVLNYKNEQKDNKFKWSPTTAGLKDIIKKCTIKLANNMSRTGSELTEEDKIHIQHRLWHALYTYDDSELLLAHVKHHFNLPIDQALKLKKISLSQGYAKFSLKALKLIVPFLKKGHLEHEAIVLAGVKNAFNHHKKEIHQKNPQAKHSSLETIIEEVKNILEDHKKDTEHEQGGYIPKIKDQLQKKHRFSDKALNKLYHHSAPSTLQKISKYLPISTKKADKPIQSLRNPNVIQALFRLRKVYNTLVETYGQPDEIHIELARDLTRTKKEKEAIEKKQKLNKTINDNAKEELKKLGIPITRYHILKYKLWKECNSTCPYTLVNIPLEDRLQGLFTAQWEIEHITPRSVVLDDSFANLTLCHTAINNLKSNQTPYEFFDKNPHKLPESYTWQTYVQKLEKDIFKTSSDKLNRFVAHKKASELNEMASRYLNDTRYMSREAVKYLGQVCSNLQVTKGSVTSILREQWNLNSLLHPESYNTKNRDDHRHHAIDALVIACTTPSHIQQLSKWRSSPSYMDDWRAWAKKATRYRPSCPKLAKPWDTFEQELENKLDTLLVSYYSPNKVIKRTSRIVKQKTATSGNLSTKKRHEGLAIRGQLHEESYYGRRLTPGKDKNNDQNYRYHRRKRITSITSENHIAKIADLGIQRLIKDRIQELGHIQGQSLPPNTFYDKKYHILKTEGGYLTEKDTIEIYDYGKHKKTQPLQLSLFDQPNSTLPIKDIKISKIKKR